MNCKRPAFIAGLLRLSLRGAQICAVPAPVEASRAGCCGRARRGAVPVVGSVDGWEKAVESFRLDFDVDIYITGSNAYLLSTEFSTLLSGRYIEIKMLPLSFKEFLDDYDRKDKWFWCKNDNFNTLETKLLTA